MNLTLFGGSLSSEFNKTKSIIESELQLKKQRFISRVQKMPGNVIGSSRSELQFTVYMYVKSK